MKFISIILTIVSLITFSGVADASYAPHRRKHHTVSGAFSPTDIAGLDLWLDASDSSTLYDADTGGSLTAADGEVGRWEDKSGNGNDATQSSSTLRPLRRTSQQNSLDSVEFDGSNDYLSGLSIAQTDGNVIIAAIDTTNIGTSYRNFLNRSGGANPACYLGATSYRPNLYWQGIRAAWGSSVQTTCTVRWEITEDGTSDGASTTINNGTPVTSSGNYGTLGNWVTIGTVAGSQAPDIHVFEILIYQSLTSDEIDDVETYLNDKWAVY